ncbi:MAG: hypothetical protein DRJ42_07735 [Deltaproteobacteria bacterium]|nr:MAG: hypothetical protein DRJ42_07735 [Deltaproteobacteria bacterium]
MIVLSGGLGASEAAAQYNLSYDGGDAGMLHCDLMVECGDGFEECSDGQLCGGVGSRGGDMTVPQYCHYAEESFVCCNPRGPESGRNDCLLFHTPDGADPALVARGDCLSAATDRGVCNYPLVSEADGTPETFTFCAEALEDAEAWIRPCMTAPDGTPVEHWDYGDCDEDGVTNGDEFFVFGCKPCDDRNLPDPDTGNCGPPPMPDAGTDGGLDAGADTGVGPDAAADSSIAPDATPGVDSSEDTGTFRGTGGCTCRAAGSTPSDDGALPVGLFVAALTGLAFRFRSSRRGGRGL